jgi:hypothetical protein
MIGWLEGYPPFRFGLLVSASAGDVQSVGGAKSVRCVQVRVQQDLSNKSRRREIGCHDYLYKEAPGLYPTGSPPCVPALPSQTHMDADSPAPTIRIFPSVIGRASLSKCALENTPPGLDFQKFCRFAEKSYLLIGGGVPAIY